MDILQIVILAIIASLLYLILKEINQAMAFFIVVITGIIIFLAIIHQIGAIFNLLETLSQKANIDSIYLETILLILLNLARISLKMQD